MFLLGFALGILLSFGVFCVLSARELEGILLDHAFAEWQEPVDRLLPEDGQQEAAWDE